jgi:hypothetical protein
MNMAAFVSLEDISAALPPYTEEIVSVEMDPPLREAYQNLEDDISEALRDHHGNSSVISTAMNALLLYPDKPHGFGPLYGYTTNEDGERERFLISEPADLDENVVYAKERRLIEECKKEIAAGAFAAGVCCVHAKARRDAADAESPTQRRYPSRSAYRGCPARAAGSVVREEARAGHAGVHLSP